MVFGTGLDIAVVLLLTAVFLKYSGYLKKNLKKPVGFIMAGVMFLLINAVWRVWTGMYADIQMWLSYVWQIIAFILVLIGGLWATVEFTKQ